LKGGFIYDAKMDKEVYFPDRKVVDLLNFKTSCMAFDLTNTYLGFDERLSNDCDSWTPTGESLIAQHPHRFRNESKYEYIELYLTYNNEFITDGFVQFKYRSSQKQNSGFVNGQLEFKIDGLPQLIYTGVIYSDQWIS
jgi:hypothetical protein